MILLGIIALVLLLYARTIIEAYLYVIDDAVKRDGYLYDVPESPPAADFFKTRPSRMYRVFMIGMHCVNVSIIYMLWGWGPALIFAVHPQCVWGVAWVTGNYYATAAYFTLIAYFILHTFPNIAGAIVAMPIFAAALNSTVCPITFPFLASFVLWPWGLSMFWPLAAFLTGKRFKTGIKIRHSFNENKKLVDCRPTPRRLFLMVKTVARYTYDSIVPEKIGFFSGVGKNLRDRPEVYKKYHSADKDFWASLALVSSVFALCYIVNPVGALWFFVIIALHSQWNMTGQFYAQRYLYLPIVGLCIVAGQLLQPYPILITIVATYLAIRAHRFIPAWKTIGDLYVNDLRNYPENAQVYNNYAQYVLATGGTLSNVAVNEIATNVFRSESMDDKDWACQMNIAAFFATIGQWEEAYKRTIKSMIILEPLGGIRRPMDCLLIQKANIEKRLLDKYKPAGGSALGRPLSHPPVVNGSTTQESGKSHGQRKRDDEEAVPESVGAGVAPGGKEGAGVSA